MLQPTPSEILGIINLDFLGPFPSGQYVLVMIDQCTKYLHVEFMRSTSARDVIFALKRFCSSCGIPNKITLGNGPCFTSYKLQEYFLQEDMLIMVPSRRLGRTIYAIKLPSQRGKIGNLKYINVYFHIEIEIVPMQQLKYHPSI